MAKRAKYEISACGDQVVLTATAANGERHAVRMPPGKFKLGKAKRALRDFVASRPSV